MHLQRFVGTCSLNLDSLTLKIEAQSFSETMAICQISWHHTMMVVIVTMINMIIESVDLNCVMSSILTTRVSFTDEIESVNNMS